MALTAIIPHPNFPDFKVTIEYQGRVQRLRRMRKLNKTRIPEVVRIRNDKGELIPFMKADGDPHLTFVPDLDDQFTIDSINDWLRGWENFPTDLGGAAYNKEHSDALLDEGLDVTRDEEVEKTVDGVTTKVTEPVKRSWSAILADKASDRATFIPVPTGAPSAMP